MKKLITLITLTLFAKIALSVITVAPTNLTGVQDTARCQHTYYKTFTASGGTAPYRFTVTVGSIPTGMTLDSITGVLSGTVSYFTNTSVSFTIQARQKTGSAAGTRAYTIYIRNTTLTAAQLTNIWSTSQVPARPDVYDTWYNSLTSPASSLTNLWKLTGNDLPAYSGNKIGSTDSSKIEFISKNVTRFTLLPTGYFGVATTSPTSLFHVNGTGGIRYVDGSEGVGKYLKSDANGVASWASFGNVTGSGTTSSTYAFRAYNATPAELFEIRDDGFVGINSAAPNYGGKFRVGGISEFGDAIYLASEGLISFSPGSSAIILAATVTNRNIRLTTSGTGKTEIQGKLNISDIPHDSTGLTTGDIYVDALGKLSFKY